MTTMSRILAAALTTGMAIVAAAWGAPQPGETPETSITRPGDEAMTCEQIAAELVPYMQQVAPNAQAIVVSQQREFEHAQAKRAERQPANERSEDAAEAASPQAQKSKAQREQMATQAQAMQGDAHLQRLLQLGQQK